jgi:peptidyl-prolyl cis-trans isomerase A (cyclophilin A)
MDLRRSAPPLFLLLSTLLLSGCGGSDTTNADAGVPGSDAQVAADAAPDAAAPGPFDVTERVAIATSMGTIVVALYGNGAPTTVQNFLSYVDSGGMVDTVFHRVIPDFMIQGGGLYEDLSAAPATDPIPLEILEGLSHQPGVISMARTSDPDSARNQFFICVGDDSFLDGQYAAFGEVESGYEVVEAIAQVDTHTVGAYEDVPVTPVVIQSLTRLGPP